VSKTDSDSNSKPDAESIPFGYLSETAKEKRAEIVPYPLAPFIATYGCFRN
jgi:hypothetical protein